MENEEVMNVEDVKRILQLYASLARLEVLNPKIDTSKSRCMMLKTKLEALENEGNEAEMNKTLVPILVEVINEVIETDNLISSYHKTLVSILRAYEKGIYQKEI